MGHDLSVLITGANRGIGLEFCKQYLDRKATVYATCRSPDQATELHDLKREFGGKLIILPLDVLSSTSLLSLSRTMENKPLDLLINNAGIGGPAGFYDLDSGLNDEIIDQWLNTFHINCIAPIKVSLALKRNLEQVKGKIAIIGSSMGSVSRNFEGIHYAYRASKSSLNSATKSLFLRLKDFGIHVILLHPGWVKTDMGGAQADLEPKQSVLGMMNVIESYECNDPDQFSMLDYKGSTIPW